MSTRVRIVAAALAGSLGLAVCALPAHAASPPPVVSRDVVIPAFYTPPATLPAADGALVRSEPLPLALSLPDVNGPMPGRATRIMYKTTDSTGRPAAVTGAYLEPSAKWSGPGPRPLVVLAPGTMGQGDQCSASLGLERGIVVGAGGTASIGYENLAVYRLLGKGIAVVETDYVGLGATDRLHTYVDRIDGGHAVLDAARAARALKGTSLTPASPVGLYGYSQGGGAVASAAELQSTYAPDVPLKATYSGAPPADLAATTAAIDGSELAGALGWAINGFLQSAPQLDPIVDAYLNDAGRGALKNLSTMCVGDALVNYAYSRSTAWTTNGESISDIVKAEPVVRDFFATQLIGKRKPAGIVRVGTSISDNLVPHGQARTMAVDWCALGGKVVYAPVMLPNVGSALVNHFIPAISDQGAAVEWVNDRLAGKPAASTCGSIASQP